MRKAILLSLLISVQIPLFANLSQADQDSMATNLEKLRATWDESAKDVCNTIIAKSNYNAQDWADFFITYYSNHSYNNNLRNYLGYPMFFWFGSDTHFKLQFAHRMALVHVVDSVVTSTQLADVIANDQIKR